MPTYGQAIRSVIVGEIVLFFMLLTITTMLQKQQSRQDLVKLAGNDHEL